MPREAVSAHLATDDKAALARLQDGSSQPSAPPVFEDHEHPEPTVPILWEDFDEEDDGAGPSTLDTKTDVSPSMPLFPPPPALTSAHLFPGSSEAGESMLLLPGYSGGAVVVVDEKATLVPSAPPTVDDLTLLPSAPSHDTNEEEDIAPSAPPLPHSHDDDEDATAPSYEP